jgi:hypothetical protein
MRVRIAKSSAAGVSSASAGASQRSVSAVSPLNRAAASERNSRMLESHSMAAISCEGKRSRVIVVSRSRRGSCAALVETGGDLCP